MNKYENDGKMKGWMDGKDFDWIFWTVHNLDPRFGAGANQNTRNARGQY